MAQPQLIQIALDSGGHNAIGVDQEVSLAWADSAVHERANSSSSGSDPTRQLAPRPPPAHLARDGLR